MYGPKGEEVTGGWRKVQNKDLHNFQCYQGDELKQNEMGGLRNTHGEDEH